jgi:Domain of unknown function (DUF6458)
MGFGANLAFIAIGAVLAFATHFTVSGIDLRTVGWILIAVGVIGLVITFAYIRPRRAARMVEVVDEEPPYAEAPTRWYSRRRVRTVPQDRYPQA